VSSNANIYCLDANVLIQAWNTYYNPKFCPDYWNILIKLGKYRTIFVPEVVLEEITRTEDDLTQWLKASKIPIEKYSEPVISSWKEILSNPVHKKLVDSAKGRSIADPWVVAHALHRNATVVTKEEKITASSSKRIKIPNVCENMGIRWINDFQFVDELKIRFTCSLVSDSQTDNLLF